MKITNIIFDFDGTLADTAPLIVATMQAAIRELGLPAKTDAECRGTIGLRLEEVADALWPENQISGELYAAVYRRIFDELKRPLAVKCFDGVSETLRQLHADGYGMAIASSRSHSSLDEYVSQYDFDDVFSAIVGGNDVEHGKPAPDAVLTICRRLGWKPAETLVIGDAVYDIEMGRNAGAQTCAVTYGNQSREQLVTSRPDILTDNITELMPVLAGVSPEVADYVESKIIPHYDAFDKAHRRDHARMVIRQSLRLADHMPALDRDMVYVIAAFHDLGMVNGRERHHIDSAEILRKDAFVCGWFSPQQIEVMAEAVEDHRASGKAAPRSDYGLVVADADRFIDAETIIRRTIQYGLSNYPELDREGHYRRTLDHLTDKYGPDGYLSLRIPWSDNAARLKQLQAIIADEQRLHEIFDRIFAEESGDQAEVRD